MHSFRRRNHIKGERKGTLNQSIELVRHICTTANIQVDTYVYDSHVCYYVIKWPILTPYLYDSLKTE